VAFHDKLIAENPDQYVKVKSAKDARKAKKEGKMGLFYHLQSCFCLEENLDTFLPELKKAGLGLAQPTYNFRNRFSNGQLERGVGGLSTEGIKLVKKLNEYKIIVDGSHNGTQDVLDMIEHSSAPVIVSHGNSKTVYDHPRNITDEVALAIAKNGGLVGVVGWPPFVTDKQLPTFDDFFAHIDYYVKLIGVDHVGLGMDYFQLIRGLVPDDEVKRLYDYLIDCGAWTVHEYGHPPYVYPEGIETPDKMENMTEELLKRGYSKEMVEKIMGDNWLRIMETVWGE